MDEQIINSLRKELLMTRIICLISCIMMVVTLVGGFLFYQKTQEYEKQLKSYVKDVQEHSEEIEAALAQIAMLDMDVLNDTLRETLKAIQAVDWKMLNDSIASVDWKMLSEGITSVDWKMLNDNIESVDWENLSKQLNALDVQAINDAVEGLDTEEVTLALENLNSGIEKLKKAVDAMNTIGDKLGGYFK